MTNCGHSERKVCTQKLGPAVGRPGAAAGPSELLINSEAQTVHW
jgi:hypothetical protein